MSTFFSRFMLRCIATVLSSAIAVPAFSTAENETRNGYWWGKGFNEPVETEEEKKDEYPTPAPLPDSKALMDMHPEQLRALEKEHMDYALWKQTPEAVQDYYRIITAIRKKAKTFAALASYNNMVNPKLSTAFDAPASNQGIKVKREVRKQTISTKLSQNSTEFALVLFTSKSCSYCESSRSVNRIFNNRHGWIIKEVDIDENPQLAARHDIEQTPTTIVIRRNSSESMPVAFGVESVPSLEENAYRAVRLMLGEITPKEFFSSEEQKGRALDPASDF